MSEKDFCSLLNEQIMDERNAQKAYRRLLDLFEEEKDLLVPPHREFRHEREHGLNFVRAEVKDITRQEANHLETLEELRQILCEAKE